MTKSKVYNIFIAILLITGTIEIELPDNNEVTNDAQFCAGVNGKQVQQGVKAAKGGWKFLRSCVGCEGEAEKVIANPEIEGALGKLARSNRLIAATELLGKSIEEAKASDEVLPKIGEYLSKTEPNEGGQKVINCFRNDANEVRMYLYDYGNNKPKLNKLLLGAKETDNNAAKLNKLLSGAKKTINLAEYDIQAMQEHFYRGADGIEYVDFVIPRRSQYILNGKYKGRIYECMIFNIPKDIEGGWVRFKEYLIAFIKDILNRPGQLWDEYMFRRGLVKMNINPRDVNEIEQYRFAQINGNKYHESIKHIQKQVA